jgi:hypothetical protein
VNLHDKQELWGSITFMVLLFAILWLFLAL